MYMITIILFLVVANGLGQQRIRNILFDLSPEVEIDAYVFYWLQMKGVVDQMQAKYDNCYGDTCYINQLVAPMFPVELDEQRTLAMEDIFSWDEGTLNTISATEFIEKQNGPSTFIDHVVLFIEGETTRNRPIDLCDHFKFEAAPEKRKHFRHSTQISRALTITYQSHQCLQLGSLDIHEAIPEIIGRSGNSSSIYLHHADRLGLWSLPSKKLKPGQLEMQSRSYWNLRKHLAFSGKVMERGKTIMNSLESPFFSLHVQDLGRKSVPIKSHRRRFVYQHRTKGIQNFYVISDQKEAFNRRLEKTHTKVVLAQPCHGLEHQFFCRSVHAYICSESYHFIGMKEGNFSRFVNEQRDRLGRNDDDGWGIHCPKSKRHKSKRCHRNAIYPIPGDLVISRTSDKTEL